MPSHNTFRKVVRTNGPHVDLDLPESFANRRLTVMITPEESENSLLESRQTTSNIVKRLRGRGKQYKINQTASAVDNLVAERARD